MLLSIRSDNFDLSTYHWVDLDCVLFLMGQIYQVNGFKQIRNVSNCLKVIRKRLLEKDPIILRNHS